MEPRKVVGAVIVAILGVTLFLMLHRTPRWFDWLWFSIVVGSIAISLIKLNRRKEG